MSKKQPRNRREAPPQETAAGPKDKKTLIGSLLQLPASSLSQMTQIQLIANREALVDGCKGVIEYNEDYIRLNLGNMAVRFCGRGLQLRSMSEESVIIDGFIQSVEYIQ
ncbi:MAG: hypothetical protein HFG26_02455 [Provencibacterium sp.]|jgi:sporulation protein YqfC|nr:hypothetical protein [Provencibacterium sp.]